MGGGGGVHRLETRPVAEVTGHSYNPCLFSIPGRGPTFFLGLRFPMCLIDSGCDFRFQEGGDQGEGGWTMRRGEGRGAEGALDLLTSCPSPSTPGLGS